MRRFSGLGGSLFSLGERHTFDTALYNCGDGWDWRAPEEFSYWLEEPIITVVRNGEHIQTGVVEMHMETGRVGLPCNMSQGYVFAEGVCRPISWLAEGTRWEIVMETVVPEINTLGSEHVQTAVRVGAMTGALHGVEVPIGEVLARFPLGGAVFTGIGDSAQVGPDAHIEFREGVRYVPC